MIPRSSLGARIVQDLDDGKRRAIADWIAANIEALPAEVQEFLRLHEPYLAAGQNLEKRLNAAVRELRRALGVTPSSERRRSVSSADKPPATYDPRASIEQRIAERERRAAWHKEKRSKHQVHLKKLKEKLAKMVAHKKDDNHDEEPRAPALDDYERTEEEAADDARAVKLYTTHLSDGDGPDPAMLSVNEALMPAGAVLQMIERERIPAEVPPDLADARVIKTLDEDRVRYDFAVTVTRIELSVEKKVLEDDDGERVVVSGSTQDFGPPRYGVTWEALATLGILAGQFATPLHRLGVLFSTPAKKFTAGSLSRMLRYVAVRALPIYLELADQLANASILAGDDTSCRVLEVTEYQARCTAKANEASSSGEKPAAPWAEYSTTQVAERNLRRREALKAARLRRRAEGDREAIATPDELPTLGILIGSKLGFEWPRKSGEGPKTAMHTTVVSGRSEADDPRSLIVFYRSHLGSCGNLLEQLLRFRDKKNRRITIQGDLSTTNLVTAPDLLETFEILQIACYAHARRPFALYEDEDPDHCEYMLHLFLGLAMHEGDLDEVGRNEKNVLAVRQNESREMWGEILALATSMSERWSKATNLGTAARYIINHFAELTAYLDDPRLEATNNLRERMLRTEKLIERSSMFRRSLEGRFVLDIVRTLLQTAVAAGAPAHEYLVWALRSSPDEVEARPADFTPHAWMKARA